MSARIVVQQCSDRRDHAIHVTDARPSIYAAEDDAVRYLCGGDRTGDKRIRDAESIRSLVAEIDAEADPIGTAFERVFGVALESIPRHTGPDPSLDVSEPYHEED